MASISTNSIVEAIVCEASSLKTYLENVDEQTWTSDSTSDGWTIEDIAFHLSVSVGGWASNITRAVAGHSGPPDGQSFVPSGQRASHPSGPSAREFRQKSRAQILDDFTSGHEHLQNVIGMLSEEDWAKPCFHRRGVLPVKAYLSIQIQELALHGWDIRWGIDSKAELSLSSLPPLLELVPRWIGTAFTPGLDLPVPVRYRFDVSDPLEVRKDLIVSGDTFSTEQHNSEAPDAIFGCDTGNYLLLMFGRLQVEHAVADGRLVVEGSLERAKNFNNWFKGF